jgi:site-specific recombinase XerD
MTKITRKDVPRLLNRFLPGRRPNTLLCFRRPLFQWLRFQGRFTPPAPQVGWQKWLDDYLDFLQVHRGVAFTTIQRAKANVSALLKALFGNGKANWARVQPADLWRFAFRHIHGASPNYAEDKLGQVRRFMQFVMMQGACSQRLLTAFPKVANHGSCTRPSILSKEQERDLLAGFDHQSPEGKRDYAMTLCMLHLGLRAVEVTRLQLSDFDWQNRCLKVPPAKMGRGRKLPIPERVLAALKDYITNGRPKDSGFEQLFLRHPRRRGYPLSQAVLKHATIRAYRRCGFPRSWCGTHRLRHTFASRLHQRGADLKPIADLLGHRHLDSATVYTHSAPHALQALAQPWPW